MAQIGYGHGSEFQLMRFLGHHRHLLESEICKQTGIGEGQFNWLDFDFADRRKVISGDKELSGLSFLSKILDKKKVDDILKDYKRYKIRNINTWQSWDAVFTLDKTIYLVEAKARVGEMAYNRKERKSDNEILSFMKDNLSDLPVSSEWLKRYYQLANRLATTAFLQKKGISAKTICIFFTNGFSKPILGEGREWNKIVNMANTNDDASIADYKNEIKLEMETLGIREEDKISHLLTKPVFIEANPILK